MPLVESRTYSAARKYQVDLANSQVTEVWHYLPDPSVYSPFCSNNASDNYLIDYTLGRPYIFTGIVGLDGQGTKRSITIYD